MDNLRFVLFAFAVWRLLLFLPVFLSDKFLKFRPGFEYVNGNVWANFDGLHYLSIASNGYTVYNSAFFPLYPLLVKIFSVGDSTKQFYVALILSSLFFLLGLIVFYKLIKLDYSNRIAILTILAFLVFPTSFFFAGVYSESLFFLLLVLSFFFARKRNWFLSSLFAGLLTATRIVGIAILPALIYEFYKTEKKFKTKFLNLILIPVGLLSYMWYNSILWGDPLHFIRAQDAFANNRSVDKIILLPQVFFRYFKILSQIPVSQYEWWIALLEISIFIFVLVFLFIAWRKKIRTSYLIFSILVLVIPTLTGTFTGIPRYVLPVFPAFMTLALVEKKFFRIIYFAVGTILLIILFALFSKGYFIA